MNIFLDEVNISDTHKIYNQFELKNFRFLSKRLNIVKTSMLICPPLDTRHFWCFRWRITQFRKCISRAAQRRWTHNFDYFSFLSDFVCSSNQKGSKIDLSCNKTKEILTCLLNYYYAGSSISFRHLSSIIRLRKVTKRYGVSCIIVIQ